MTVIHLNSKHLILLSFVSRIKVKRKICEKEKDVQEESTVDKTQMHVEVESAGQKQNVIQVTRVLCQGYVPEKHRTN
jgi:primosomal replication protein N